jgi:hypothetical protein
MKRKLRTLLLSLALCLSVLVAAVPAFAATNPFSDVCTMQNAHNSAVCQSNGGPNPFTSSGGLIFGLAKVIAIFGGVAAVIVLVVGGFRYVTSNGDAEQVAQAKRTIIYALIGLIVIALGSSIVNFVIFRI